jgi:hypothetical protein
VIQKQYVFRFEIFDETRNLPDLSAQAQKFGILMKKALLGIRTSFVLSPENKLYMVNAAQKRYFVINLPTVRQNCYSDQEQFIQRCENNFW